MHAYTACLLIRQSNIRRIRGKKLSTFFYDERKILLQVSLRSHSNGYIIEHLEFIQFRLKFFLSTFSLTNFSLKYFVYCFEFGGSLLHTVLKFILCPFQFPMMFLVEEKLSLFQGEIFNDQ